MKTFQYPNELMMELLPPQITRDNFIRGMRKYSYEDYLTEFVNMSKHFCDEKEIQKYRHINKEDQKNGECDCISENNKYMLDFKLICSQEGMRAKQFTCYHEAEDEKGCRFLYTPLKDGLSVNRTYRVGITSTIAKKLNEEIIKAIIDNNEAILNKYDEFYIREATPLVKMFVTNKNVLFLYDGYFYRASNIATNQEVANWFGDRFQELLKFRLKHTKKDTYIALFVEDKLIILKYINEKLIIIEELSIKNSETLKNLLRIQIFDSELARRTCLHEESYKRID